MFKTSLANCSLITFLLYNTDTASKDQGKSQPHNEEQDDSAVQDVEMESKEDETLEAVNVERLKPEEQRSHDSIKQGKFENWSIDYLKAA